MYTIKLLDYFSHPLKFYILNIKDVIPCHNHIMCKSDILLYAIENISHRHLFNVYYVLVNVLHNITNMIC